MYICHLNGFFFPKTLICSLNVFLFVLSSSNNCFLVEPRRTMTESLYPTRNQVYFMFTQEVKGANSVMPSVTLWDYRHILEHRVLLTSPSIIIQLPTCCCSRAGFVTVPGVGRTKPQHDTCRGEGLSNLQESEQPSSAEREDDRGKAWTRLQALPPASGLHVWL